jgi:hypothetical protein
MSELRGADIGALQERAKELSCLYRVMKILAGEGPIDEIFQEVVGAIPSGWQYPEVTTAELAVDDRRWRAPGFAETPWAQTSHVRVRDRSIGSLRVLYTQERPARHEGPFLAEERQLLDALSEQVGLFLTRRGVGVGEAAATSGSAPGTGSAGGTAGWAVVMDFLDRTDPRLVRWLTLKMLNHLRWRGVEEADRFLPDPVLDQEATAGDNRPIRADDATLEVSTEEVFALALQCCPEQEILGEVRAWITQDRARFLVSTVEDQAASLTDIGDALERFENLGVEEDELPRAIQTMLRVGLLRRFFSEEIHFINSAKSVVRIADFRELARRLLHPRRSQGKLGGKSAGLFVAQHLVEADAVDVELLAGVRVPRTWYVASDGVLAFVRYNHLEDVYDRKYLEVEEVRRQYPHVVHVLRNSTFPPELAHGLSRALDDLGEGPLIVRSSSLLEDRSGSSFSGKYKSLFLANRGTKEQRLRALQQAVAEVYASIFAPDPIEYRAARNLLDVHEEMGIMIQPVVGRRVGRYFLPAFSGVALSTNELRWSPRIERGDGLVRLVPGLGTRAVDRLSDDYPVLFAPGKPGLRVNQSPDEVVRYAPRMVDLIDLEERTFATLPVERLLEEVGGDLPLVRQVLSVVEDGRLRRPGPLDDLARTPTAVTFEGLASDTSFLGQVDRLLSLLGGRLGRPVDVEFAHDGAHLYLLQCRPQSYTGEDAPARIPRDLPEDRVLFSAHRYVSNGRVPDITHVVYVVPERYTDLPDPETMREVGRVVGRLNKALPRHRFILMGPGRWGSRGDIRLGVPVGYADIGNTAVLVEVARRRGDYVPDLSFGTHFFQDLVEAGIRYLPLYPDEPGNVFNEGFFLGATNRLTEFVPRATDLAQVVRVVDVPAESDGRVLRVLMNGEDDEAVGLIGEPGQDA